jgi:8-oxo-dGTP diphosphatase
MPRLDRGIHGPEAALLDSPTLGQMPDQPIDLPFLPHRTQRLALRLLRPADAPAIQSYVSDPAVALMTARIPHPYPEGAAAEFIAEMAKDVATGRRLICAVATQDDDAVVGAIELNPNAVTRQAELGYWIGKPFWGRGYATEAGAAMLALGFRELGLRRIMARALEANPASIRVQEHLGFSFVRSFVGKCRPDGACASLAERMLDREQWLAAGAAKPTILVSAVALVDVDGRVLIARRPEGKPMAGLWEFPGGKVHDGETPEAALIRELHEELGIDTHLSCLAPLTFASHAYASFHLLMPVFACRKWTGTPTPREGQTLKWVRPKELKDYPMPPADVPLIPMLRDML